MTSFDPFLESTVENTEFCCDEKPQKPHVQKVLVVPRILNPAPTFSATGIVNIKIQHVSLRDYKGQYVILLFYPYDFTFNCPIEMIQFNDRIEEFHKLDCEVMAISTDSQYAHLTWIITPRKEGGLGQMKIPVLSDKNQKISRMYGVLDEEQGISQKGLFIIDSSQLIRHITITDSALSRSVDETLRILEACKFVDEYGSTCPAGPRERLPDTNSTPNYFSA